MGKTVEFQTDTTGKDAINHELYNNRHTLIEHPDFNDIRENLSEENQNACISITDAKMLKRERKKMDKLMNLENEKVAVMVL